MRYYDFCGGANLNDLDTDFNSYEKVKELYETGGYSSRLYSLMNDCCIKSMGWCYIFDDVNELKKFVVKTKYDLREYYAPNKTLLRKNIHSKIKYILEVK